MAHAEATISIQRPVAEVYEFLLDGMNNPHWRSAVIGIQRVPGKPSGVGAIYKQGLKGSGGLKMQAQDLTQKESLRPFPNGNCLNWVLGHIAVNRDEVLQTLGEPPVMNPAGARYKRGSEPLTETEEGILTLEELLTWLDLAQVRIATALSKMDETALTCEYGSGERKTTVEQRAFFLYFHESYHVGQTELYRQFAGKADKLI